ncbi:hypothetical protein LOK74_17415 [Brevibacillus humidisoli]|uniref:hypothetical protein n=1 Tax=Brevibacillus humidisoli TaxID=2895522 RepID=UPI001E642E63|nr:hypothetical protein [Brevibacillus humidisoli]UFJ39813.1 hypothetical protein LOK74_17415 [Brevibacillus humidisoli]
MKTSRISLVIAAGVLAASLQTGMASSDDSPRSSVDNPSTVETVPGSKQQLPSQDQIKAVINASAEEPVDDSAELFMRVANLDDDPEPEIAAYTNDAVHLGMFYLLDRQGDAYNLIAEKAWNVPHFAPKRWYFSRFDAREWNSKEPMEVGKVAGKRLFEVINRTGGTGMDTYEVHLCYLENGTLHEAWSGILKERVSLPGGGTHLQFGNYQVVEDEGDPVLLVWETKGQAPDGEELDQLLQAETRMQQYTFDGSQFVPADHSPYTAANRFLEARLKRNPVQLMRTSSEALVESSPWLIGQANPHLLRYVIEEAQPEGDGVRYRVLLFYGNHQTTLAVESEQLLVEQVESEWRVTEITRLAQQQLGQLELPEADEASLAVVRAFLDARMKRDREEIEQLLSPAMQTKAQENGYISLIGTSNPHPESYDLLSVEKQQKTVIYHVRMYEAVTDMGITHSHDEQVSLEKIDGRYQVVDVQQ